MKNENLNQSFDQVLKEAKNHNVEFEFSYSESEKFSASYQMRKIRKYSVSQSQTLQIRVISGAGVGTAMTENLSPDAIQSTFKEALQTARDLSKEKKSAPVMERMLKSTEKSSLKMDEFKMDSISTEQKLKRAYDIEDIALKADSRIKSLPYNGYSEFESTSFLMNSLGTQMQSSSSGIQAYAYALAEEGGQKKNGHHSEFHRTQGNYSSERVALECVKNSLEVLSAKQPSSGIYNVVFSAEVFSELLAYLTGHFSAKQVDEGTSLFKDKLHQSFFPSFLDIKDDATQVDLMGAQAFDSEGTLTKPLVLVEKGEIKNFLTNDYYARKLNLPNTGHASLSRGKMSVGSTNIIMQKGNQSLTDLLQGEEIIYIKSLAGLHSGLKPSTLNFSLGAEGVLYKRGERIHALDQFVISGNIIHLINQIVGVGNKMNGCGQSIQCPDVLVEKVSIAGQ